MGALRRLLTSSEAFMPHGHCYLWKPGLVWLHVVSDGLITLAYLSIPFTLLHFARRRRDLPFRWLFLAFGAFIVSCGATHAFEVWNVWRADYWPAGLVKAVTAAMSVATAVLLARAVPEALALPSPAELSQAHEDLARAHAELRRAYGEEKAALHERTTELRAAGTRIRDEARARGEAEERFRAVYEQSRLGIALLTAGELRFVSANPAYCRMLGFTEAELKERCAFDVIHPDDRAGARRLAASPAAVTPLPIEERQVRKDGGVIWARVLVSPLRDETGRVALWLAMIEDISDAKRAEQDLRESEARMRAIVETAVDGIVTIGESGRIESFNPAAERLFGYAASEAIGQNVSLLMPAPYREQHDGYLRDYLATGVRKVIGIGREVVGRHKDGREFPIDIAVTEFWLGQRRLFTGIVRDITARRAAEDEVRRTHTFLRAILDGTTDAVSIKDLEGRYLLANPSLAHAFGRPASEVLGRTAAELVDAQSAAAFAANDARARESGETLTVEETLASQGRTYLSTLGVVRDPTGRVIGTFGVSREITERKRAEQELRLQKEILETVVDNIPVMVSFFDATGRLAFANREFERALGWTFDQAQRIDFLAATYPDPEARRVVVEFIQASEGRWRDFRTRTRDGRTLDTEWASIRLSDGTILGVGQDVTERKRLEAQFLQAQKLEAVGRLAGGVAHDFNNLLGVITGYSEMARRTLEAGHPALGKIAQVLQAAERAAGLTRQLLAFSRRQTLAPKVIDLNALLMDLEKMLHRLIGEDVELVVRPGADLGAVRVDAGQIEQVVMNLVVNARDAMPRGGRLVIETANLDLDDQLSATHGPVTPGPYVALAVLDTGEGMDPATQVRIFEPFFTTKEPGAGTGLGLATVYGIVKQSGGAISVHSEVGRGTTFKVYLPRVREADSVLVAPAPRSEPSTGDETILVVEDQEALREVTAEILGSLGYTVLMAEHAEAALELAKRHSC